MGQFRVRIDDDLQKDLEAFCELCGATKSGVIEVLIRDYLEDLAESVAKFAESEEDAEFEDEDEDEDEVLFKV